MKYINETMRYRKCRYKDYKQKKIDELYTRMGNTILKEIKEIVVEKEQLSNNKINKNNKIILTARDINRLKRICEKDFESIKNKQAYDKLQNQIDYENILNM